DAGDHVEHRGLARAVGADQREDLPFPDGQVDLVQGGDAHEPHRDGAEFEQVLARLAHWATSSATLPAGSSGFFSDSGFSSPAFTRRRRRDGSRPSGRSAIISTWSAPKTSIR